MPSNQEVIEQILALTDYSKGVYYAGSKKYPTQGQMVITGPQMSQDLQKRIGFCVQIRKNCGQFGSDMVFLRHPDGSLTTHENQAYFAMSEHQEALARTIFTDLPEDEDFAHGYRCCQGVYEVGFIVEISESEPTPNTPFSMTIESSDSDGEVSRTLYTHVG